MTEAEQELEKVIRYVRAEAASLRIWALFKDYSAAGMFEELADEIEQGEHLK